MWRSLVVIMLCAFLTSDADAWIHGNAGGNFLLDNASGFLLDASAGKLTAQ